ncbi:MAG: hypothetical protein QW146_06060 [Candidatus Bathyarchaeia archaeon]
MSKMLSFLGIVLIFLGVILMAYSNTTQEYYVIGDVMGEGGTAENPSASANFSEGEWFDIFLSPGATWSMEPLLNEQYPSRFVWINLTDPAGKVTLFEFAYGKFDSSFGIYEINELAQNLSVIRKFDPREFKLKASMGGLYKATIWQVIPAPKDPFGGFFLRKIDVVVEKDFEYLLPLGAFVSVVGVAVFILALRRSSRKSLRVRKK